MPKKAGSYHPFGKVLGLEVDEAEQGRCLAHIAVNESLFNPHRVVHGGVLFSLADTCMGVALHTLLDEGESCATIELKMNFLKPVTDGLLQCDTRVVRKGRTTSVLESKVENGGSLVAMALGTYTVFRLDQE